MGNGGTSDATTPTPTSSLGTGRTAVAISSGGSHTCAILDDGSVSCWGNGGNGRLGNGGTSDEFTPTPTSSLGTGRTAVAISSGRFHTCAILDDGSVSCWGFGFDGQLGNGGISMTTTPTPTSSLGIGRTAVAISLELLTPVQFSMTVLSHVGDTAVMANWATVEHLMQTTPTPTSSLGIGRTAVAISSGGSHTCVILDDGSVSCWG